LKGKSEQKKRHQKGESHSCIHTSIIHTDMGPGIHTYINLSN